MSTDHLYLGRHITIDYYQCDTNTLHDVVAIEKSLQESAVLAGATIISSDFQSFSPQGTSGVVILAESHFTIHVWPEYDYAAVDMFACGTVNLQSAIDYMQNFLGSQKLEIKFDAERGCIEHERLETPKTSAGNLITSPGWEERFQRSKSWGIQCGVDIYDCDPESIRDNDLIKRYVRELCEEIEMKRFGETQVVYFGEDERVAGYSMTQLIETSLISGHFANESNTAYLDVFSCKYYDPNIVAEFSRKFFAGKTYKLSVNLRK